MHDKSSPRHPSAGAGRYSGHRPDSADRAAGKFSVGCNSRAGGMVKIKV